MRRRFPSSAEIQLPLTFRPGGPIIGRRAAERGSVHGCHGNGDPMTQGRLSERRAANEGASPAADLSH